VARTTRITLTAPLLTHDGPVSEIVLREPRGTDFFALGEPVTLTRDDTGTLYYVENAATIAAYVDRCVSEPVTPAALKGLALADAIAVKAAVLDFFMLARQGSSPEPTTSSSSTSASSTPLPPAP
jgi:hypothetical protein